MAPQGRGITDEKFYGLQNLERQSLGTVRSMQGFHEVRIEELLPRESLDLGSGSVGRKEQDKG